MQVSRSKVTLECQVYLPTTYVLLSRFQGW